VQTIAGPLTEGGIALDPRGTFLYAVASGTNSIMVYRINSYTGILTPATPSPLAEQSGAYTISIAPDGKSAYTIEDNNDLVSYALNNGKLTPVGNIYTHVFGQRIAVDPTSSFVYVPQACSNCPGGVYNVVNEFSIGSSGALTKFPASPVAAGTTPVGIAFTTQ